MNTKKKNTLNEHETNEQINESTDDQANMNNETNKNINKRFKKFNEKAFLAENVNKKTMNKITENDMKVLFEFLQIKNEHRHGQFILSDQLNSYICQSFVSVTKLNGEEYEPTRLEVFCFIC